VPTTQSYIQENEGLRLDAYQDTTGHWTIGYGHLLNRWMSPITKSQADTIFAQDLACVYADLARELPWATAGALGDRLVVLADMCFQLGIYGLLRFHNFCEAVRTKQWSEAVRQLLNSELYRQCPGRVERNCRVLERGVIA
jgi:lysozyme